MLHFLTGDLENPYIYTFTQWQSSMKAIFKRYSWREKRCPFSPQLHFVKTLRNIRVSVIYLALAVLQYGWK